MTKARQPQVIMVPQGLAPEYRRMIRTDLERAGFGLPQEVQPGPVPIYPDKRLMPRECSRTGMLRRSCCCAPCRRLRRRKHSASCRCWLCYSDRMGAFVDSLGSRTAAGRWAIFLTQTYRTKPMVKRLNAPMEKPEPSLDFVRHFLRRMIRWLEDELRERVEFFIVDQYGERGGRLHQHGGLTSPALLTAAEELSAMRYADPKTTRLPVALKPFAAMLVEQAGGNRILPWEQDAGYYIGRYIGRDVARCQWDFRVGSQPVRQIPPVGRQVVAVSPVPDETSSDAYRQALGKWHR